MNTGGCSAAIHFIEVREIFLISSECSSFLLGLLMLNPLHIVEGNAPHDRGDQAGDLVDSLFKDEGWRRWRR